MRVWPYETVWDCMRDLPTLQIHIPICSPIDLFRFVLMANSPTEMTSLLSWSWSLTKVWGTFSPWPEWLERGGIYSSNIGGWINGTSRNIRLALPLPPPRRCSSCWKRSWPVRSRVHCSWWVWPMLCSMGDILLFLTCQGLASLSWSLKSDLSK